MSIRSLARAGLFTVLTSFSAIPAVAQGIQDTSQPESPMLTWFLIAFCVLIVSMLAYTARRMATLK